MQSYNKSSETNDTLSSNNDTILSKYKINYFYSQYSYGFLVLSEAYVMFKWGSPELQKGLTWFWAGCIWNYIATYLALRRDVPDATSGRIFGNSIGDYTGKTASKTIGIEPKKTPFYSMPPAFCLKNTAKNHQKLLSIAIFMAIYGRLWQLKSYCNIGTFS